MGTFDQQTGDPKSLSTYFNRIDVLTEPQTEQEEIIKGMYYMQVVEKSGQCTSLVLEHMLQKPGWFH